MSEKANAEMLKVLRKEHAETVAIVRENLKEQQAVRKKMTTSLQERPLTIPEIANSTDLPSSSVMWHLMAMKKFDQIEELDLDGQYYRYRLPQEKGT